MQETIQDQNMESFSKDGDTASYDNDNSHV